MRPDHRAEYAAGQLPLFDQGIREGFLIGMMKVNDRFKSALLYVNRLKPANPDYEDLVVSAIAAIIEQTRDEAHSLSDVYIDALTVSRQNFYRGTLRKKGIQNATVHRATDHANPMIRFADALAGLVRDGAEDSNSDAKNLLNRGKRRGVIMETK